ncbi:maestro heat-like repeat-containing protein family member 1 [Natator depressus]|uniref:maestro heat-like repeat-containing protein family member 1 n=1 Tax=Natator depressus TaxID=27790 RepID=UPI003EBC2CAE
MAKDEAALKIIREQLQCRDKDEGQQLLFLQAIYPACLAARERGEDTLEPRCCKAAVVKRIVELIEELPDDSSPSAVLAHSLAAVGYLWYQDSPTPPAPLTPVLLRPKLLSLASTMKPALEPALETHLLRAALHSVFTLGTEKDTTGIQALHKVIPEVLVAMLGNLLAESPDTDRLHFILEHVNLWVVSRVSQERARAIRSSTALLRYTVTLPEFDISAEFPRMGHHVAQLALFVSDPDKDISRQWDVKERGQEMCLGVSPVLPRDRSSHPVAGVGPGSLTLTHALQALHKVIPEVLDAMLGNLLAESPDTDRLHFILEHVNLWVVSRVSQERARAIRSSTALLRYTVTLPEFDISAEFPRMGHHVAQLALFVSDPDKDISRQAREGTYRLYQLLLQQRA